MSGKLKPADLKSEPWHAAQMLDDGLTQARDAIDDAAWLIWNSIQKYEGDPRDNIGHPITCGRIYCN